MGILHEDRLLAMQRQDAPQTEARLRSRTARYGLWFAVAAAAAALLKFAFAPSGPAQANPPPAMVVSVVDAQRGAVPEILEATGKVLPSATVEIRAQIGGILKTVLVKDGDHVEVGQRLFEIDDAPLKAALALAQAQWERDKALADNAVDTETRLKPLAETGAASKKDYVTALNTRVSLVAAAAASKAQIDQARILLDYAVITSPIAGRAGAVLVKAGNLLSTASGSVPLLVINSVTPAEVQMSVPQVAFRQLRTVGSRNPVRVEVRDSGSKLPRAVGKLAFLDNAFNELSGTITLRARFENTNEELWPGEFVAARVVLRTDPDAVTIPEAALQQGRESPYVYVAENGKSRLQRVKIGRIVDGRAVVLEGLAGNESIISRVPSNLRDGTSIEVHPETGDDAPVALR